MPNEIHSNHFDEDIYLPNEILGIILSELASDINDNRTIVVASLASCRLASHALCSSATPLLFSSISFTETWGCSDRGAAFKDRATKLNQILTNNDIAASVQTLSLRCRIDNLEDPINGALINAIVHRLHIQNFIFEAWESDDGYLGDAFFEFSSISDELVSAIQSLCKSPNLITLDLCNLTGFPTSIITACPKLRSLRLSWIHFSSDFDDTSILQPDSLEIDKCNATSIGSSIFHDTPCYLDSLEIDKCSMTSIGSSISHDTPLAKYLSQIKNLKARNLFYDDHHSTFPSGSGIMLLASQSLNTLNLHGNAKALSSLWEFFAFELGRFPALRNLEMQLLIPFVDNEITLDFMTRLLSISSSTSVIETLEIKFAWNEFKDRHGKDLFSLDAGWSRLDQALTSGKFVSLRKVVLDLSLEMWLPGDKDYHRKLEFESGMALPCIHALFPMFKALLGGQDVLQINVEFTHVGLRESY